MAQNQKTKETLTQGDIHDAVADLDQANPDHWTKAGDPNIDVIRAKFGMPVGSITRADVKAATTRVQSSPPPQAEKPAETPPAENGDGESTADADEYAEKTRADADSYSQTTRADADKYYQNRKEQADKEYKTTMQNAQRDADALRKKAPPADNGGGDTASDTPTATSGDRVLVRIIEGARVHTGEADAPTAVGKEYVLVIPSTAETLIESNLAQEVRDPRPDELALAINAPAETD